MPHRLPQDRARAGPGALFRRAGISTGEVSAGLPARLPDGASRQSCRGSRKPDLPAGQGGFRLGSELPLAHHD
jgi:hypothetical protein